MENSRNKKAEEEKTVHPTHRNTHSKNEVIEKKINIPHNLSYMYRVFHAIANALTYKCTVKSFLVVC